MARQFSVAGNLGSARRNEAIIRLTQRATELDPGYARAWALMSSAQASIRIFLEGTGDAGLAAAERAIALDDKLAEAYAARAQILAHNARYDEAIREAEIAIGLDPESYEVNVAVASCYYPARRYLEAIRHWEKASALMEADYHSSGMLISCYDAIGDKDGARRSAERALVRAEKIVAAEPDNGSAMSFVVTALGVLGEIERAKDWIERGLLLDPGNKNMAYNFACTLASNFGDAEGALDLLKPMFETGPQEAVSWAKVDRDLDAIRRHPRYQSLLAAAEIRLAKA